MHLRQCAWGKERPDRFMRFNLAEKHPEIVADLAAKIAAWWPVKERKVITRYE